MFGILLYVLILIFSIYGFENLYFIEHFKKIVRGLNYMDRRQKKTRKAVFSAFSELLEIKRYEHITVQDIIDRADIGRSTFYAHFETKDMLLKEMCSDIFDHIFGGQICDYREEGTELESKLAHILWHIGEIKTDVCGILNSQSAELFTRYLNENLNRLFSLYISDFKVDVPNEFLLNYLVGSFSHTIKWWVESNMTLPSKKVAQYFIRVIETH